jgi:predicted nuclease of predicted toxin-antitoxin system
MAATIRFYTDAHIAKAAVTQLVSHGVDVVRCEDVGAKSASDAEHLNIASNQERILVTHDDDFLNLHRTWLASGKHHSGIILISSAKQGVIGILVRELLFLHNAVIEGAATPEEFRDTIWYLG